MMMSLGLMLWAAAQGALRFETFENVALSGSPSSSGAIDSELRLAVPVGGSTSLSGTLTYPTTGYYSFLCDFAGGQLVFVWILDHLVCHTNPPFGTRGQSTEDGTIVNPLRSREGQSVPILIHIYSASLDDSGVATSEANASLSVNWLAQDAPLPLGGEPASGRVPIAGQFLSAETPDGEKKRRALQDALKVGWNTWSHSLLSIVRLPESYMLITALCQLSTQTCLDETYIEDSNAAVRVGVFAADQSYWQFYAGFAGANVSFSVSGGNGTLHFLAEPLGCGGATAEAGGAAGAGVNCSDYALVVLPRYQWFRLGGIDAWPQRAGAIRFTPLGMANATVVQPTAAPAPELPLPAKFAQWKAHGVFSLGHGAVGLREGAGSPPTLQQVQEHIAKMRQAELDRYTPYGSLANVKEALQAATLWNYICESRAASDPNPRATCLCIGATLLRHHLAHPEESTTLLTLLMGCASSHPVLLRSARRVWSGAARLAGLELCGAARERRLELRHL